MKISMIGIDHSIANIEFREKFAFTKSKVIDSLKKIKEKFKVKGVVIISTCNRSEIWLSDFKGKHLDIIEEIYNVDASLFKDYFTERYSHDAVNHLFELSCGLKSKILGEDQILTQVKESAALSRETGTIDSILEKLFQISITSAKKVKTNIRISPLDTSIATKTLELLKDKYNDIKKLNCLVIGNGEIGRLSAKTLVEAGCLVTMTLRQYKRGAAIIPNGCKVIQYDDRLKNINDFDVIVSGTLSPHYTLSYNDAKILDSKKRIIIDLAMPRDIEPSIKNIESIELYDVDSLSEHGENKALNEQIEKANEILTKYINEFKDFYMYRDIKKQKYLKKVEVK